MSHFCDSIASPAARKDHVLASNFNANILLSVTSLLNLPKLKAQLT